MRDGQLAAEYLKRLRRAARTMPRARRRELLDEIADHIAEARAAEAVPLQRVLDDLGDPKNIAATGSTRSRLGVREVAAVVLLLIGGFIFIAGWIAGLILLWGSPRWRWPRQAARHPRLALRVCGYAVRLHGWCVHQRG